MANARSCVITRRVGHRAESIRLNGGRELQRCLYAFAVKALLGDDVAITASLLYPREPIDLQLDDPEAVLAEITGYLFAARTSLSGGAALPGPDTGGDYDDLAFALPANASATYCKRKLPAATERLARSRSGLGGKIMNNMSKVLKDDGARRDAISLRDRSILVEAGAGSGKTAVMAGRIAVMLAEGVSPRVLSPPSLSPNSPRASCYHASGNLSPTSRPARSRPNYAWRCPMFCPKSQRDNLTAASAAIDEITCSTIHGFCQRLIKPYPAEADIDPGASVIDRNQADLTFLEIVDGLLRERLSGGQGGILAEMVLHSPGQTVDAHL